jgi:hypothetical protein
MGSKIQSFREMIYRKPLASIPSNVRMARRPRTGREAVAVVHFGESRRINLALSLWCHQNHNCRRDSERIPSCQTNKRTCMNHIRARHMNRRTMRDIRIEAHDFYRYRVTQIDFVFDGTGTSDETQCVMRK